MAFCGNCGTQLNDGANFCPKCGQSVSSDASAPQQQDIQSQQLYEDKGETGLNIWMKILIVLLWPLGLIMGIIYKNKNKGIKAKDAFLYCTIGFGASMGMYLSNNLNGCSSNTSQIETVTKNLMKEKIEEDGNTLLFKDFTLVHKSGNEYTGIAECKVNGEDVQYSVKVICDGTNVQAEWELTDITYDASGDEEESSVSSSQANDVGETGYKDGYEHGFNLANFDVEPDAKQSYSLLYGAPSTPEEKKMYNIYKENYERGY